MTCVYPGDLVYVWRLANNKKGAPRQIQRGKFLGPCRVLATERRVDPKGNLTAGSVVWLYRGGSLIKAAPQQLRPATAREEAMNEVCNPVNIPRTIADTLTVLRTCMKTLRKKLPKCPKVLMLKKTSQMVPKDECPVNKQGFMAPHR